MFNKRFPNQSKIPEELEEVKIKDLCIGETVYVVPWCVVADKNGYVWINGEYTFSYQEQGTECTLIEKQKDSVKVYKSTIKGSISRSNFKNFVGCSEKDFIPVELI